MPETVYDGVCRARRANGRIAKYGHHRPRTWANPRMVGGRAPTGAHLRAASPARNLPWRIHTDSRGPAIERARPRADRRDRSSGPGASARKGSGSAVRMTSARALRTRRANVPKSWRRSRWCVQARRAAPANGVTRRPRPVARSPPVEGNSSPRTRGHTGRLSVPGGAASSISSAGRAGLGPSLRSRPGCCRGLRRCRRARSPWPSGPRGHGAGGS